MSRGYYYVTKGRDNDNIPLQVHYWCAMNIGPFTTHTVVRTQWVSWIWTKAHWYIAHGTADSDKSCCYPWFVSHDKLAMHACSGLPPPLSPTINMYYTIGWGELKRSTYLVYTVYGCVETVQYNTLRSSNFVYMIYVISGGSTFPGGSYTVLLT